MHTARIELPIGDSIGGIGLSSGVEPIFSLLSENEIFPCIPQRFLVFRIRHRHAFGCRGLRRKLSPIPENEAGMKFQPAVEAFRIRAAYAEADFLCNYSSGSIK